MSLLPVTRQKLIKWMGIITTVVSFVAMVIGFVGEKIGLVIVALLFIVLIALIYFNLPSEEKDPGTITAQQAAAQLKGQHDSTRVAGISKLYPRLSNQLSGKEVGLILGQQLHTLYRVDAIRILNPKIRRPIPEEEYGYIYGSLFGFYHTQALEILNSIENRPFNKPKKF